MNEDTPSVGYRVAADRLRQATTATIAAFGAIGALLVAGVQLSDLGELTSGARLLFALIALVVALAGVAIILFKQARVLMPADLSLGELVASRPPGSGKRGERDTAEREAALQWCEHGPELIDPWRSLDELCQDLGHEIEQRQLAHDTLRADQDEGRERLLELERQPMPATRAWPSIVAAANYAVLRQRADEARQWLRKGSVMIGAGLVAFVLATSVPTYHPPSLRGSVLTGADLRGANLAGADLTGANLSKATLQGANLDGAKLDGVVWTDTVCPDGRLSAVRIVGRPPTCLGHLRSSH